MKPTLFPRILIVDDEEIVRQVLMEFLTVMGYRSDFVTNGIAGIEAIANGEYHVAFADVRMPGLDGIGFLRRLQQIQPEIPVIIITGHGCEETRQEAMAAGAFAFLRKPFHFSEIQALMQRVVAEIPHDAEASMQMSV